MNELPTERPTLSAKEARLYITARNIVALVSESVCVVILYDFVENVKCIDTKLLIFSCNPPEDLV